MTTASTSDLELSDLSARAKEEAVPAFGAVGSIRPLVSVRTPCREMKCRRDPLCCSVDVSEGLGDETSPSRENAMWEVAETNEITWV